MEKQMKSERDVKAAVKVLCKVYGASFTMSVPTGYGRAGVSDFLICHKGRFIAVETKFRHGKPSAHQVQYLKEIVDAGGVALVINEDNLEELERVLAGD